MTQAAEVDPLPELPEDDDPEDDPEAEDEPDEDVDPEDEEDELDDEEPVDGVLEVEDSFGVLLPPELSEDEDVLRESLR